MTGIHKHRLLICPDCDRELVYQRGGSWVACDYCDGRGYFEICAVCRERRVENIWLEVRESNTRAIVFYTRNGFERVQTRTNFYENPREHAILMRLRLSEPPA